jgi:acyl-CoA synthetase (AMP-forming)/AMP-acid ligase II
VTFVGIDDDLRVDRVDPAALAEGLARPAEGEAALDVVSCGRPFVGHILRITDEAGAVLPEGHVGQIELCGPSVMRGYWDDPERSAAALRDGWLSTGDLGYLKDGELYVTGRLKDLIIVNGKNYYPSDLEWQASQVNGVRRGNVVAFGRHDKALGRERVVVIVETRAMDHAETLRAAVTAAILESLSLRVDEVVLLAPGGLPKTSSGKLQRARAAELYTKGALGHRGLSTLGLAAQLVASRWGYLKAGLGRRNTTPGDADV